MTDAGPRTTLDRRIRGEIEANIRSGAWLPGHRLPPEHELQARYGCARATVGKALSALAGAGLIERRKRAGTIVAHPRVHAAMLTVPDIAAVIAERGEEYRFLLTSRALRMADDTAPEEAALTGGGRLLALEGAHFAASLPFAVEHRLIRLAAVPQAEHADFTLNGPGGWLMRHIAWSSARHRISAIGCVRDDAARLKLAAGAPCLQLERWTWRDGEGVTYVRQIFPAAHFDLIAEFTPGATA